MLPGTIDDHVLTVQILYSALAGMLTMHTSLQQGGRCGKRLHNNNT